MISSSPVERSGINTSSWSGLCQRISEKAVVRHASTSTTSLQREEPHLVPPGIDLPNVNGM